MSSRLIRTILAASLSWVVIARSAPGYYHFTHYSSVSGPYTPIVEKFDLDALLDRTVYFHVSSAAPRLAANDSYEALISQIRQALAVWNSVPTSALRVAYAGTSDAPTLSHSPGGEIIFAELPPGVIGFGGPVTPLGDPKNGFVPITRSQVILSNDLTQGSRPRPTFSEVFFTSLVHEIGHALGLQHTLTSSVMSTDVTRAATRALPLGADDIAGLSVLYPSADFSALNGALTGRVTSQAGDPIHMASVVAVGPNGQVVSALTAPDGTYRIDGLLPAMYRIYVHPLPPSTQEGLGPANMRLPTTLDSQQVSPSGPFKTVFHGGTNRPSESPLVEIAAGALRQSIDFQVEPRSDLPLYNLTTFSFPGNGAAGVHPAFLDATEPTGFILATGPGLAEKLGSVSVEPLESSVDVRRPTLYELDPRFIRVDFAFSPLTSLEPTHLIFRLPDDIYVLPSGVRLTARPAPIVHWVTLGVDENERPLWLVRGADFDPRSAVYFDGWPAEVVSFDPEPEQIGVNPPVGVPGRPAVVTVYNPDGQSSAFTLPDGNVMFRFPDGPGRGVSVSPAEAEVDSDVVVEINGANTTFVPGDTTVGFGSSDVVARQVYVPSPTRAWAVATVRSNAAPGTYKLTVTTGLEVLEVPGGFRVLGPSGTPGGQPVVRFQSLVNSATMQPNLSPGVLASLFGSNLVVEGEGPVQVTFNGQAAPLVSVSAIQINLQIPAGLAPGPVVMEVHNGVANSDPMLAYLDIASPGIFAITHANGALVAPENPAVPGETLVLVATGLGLGNLASGSDGLRIASGPQLTTPLRVEPVPSLPGVYLIHFQAPARGASVSPVFIWAAGERSNALPLPLVAAAATSDRGL